MQVVCKLAMHIFPVCMDCTWIQCFLLQGCAEMSTGELTEAQIAECHSHYPALPGDPACQRAAHRPHASQQLFVLAVGVHIVPFGLQLLALIVEKLQHLHIHMTINP